MPAEPSESSTATALALELVEQELARVEERIAEVLTAREPRLTEIADYLINAGGKRIRPAVSLLVFRACGGEDITDMVDLSVALELIHTATLLHDDIIDSNDTRRGQDAAPVRFGIADTLVTGDFLFSRAFEVCGRFEERIVTWAADACVQLTEGEIMQGRFRRNPAATEADYIQILDRKTASLFGVGARIASYLATGDEALVSRMAACGLEIGRAFQMIDDVLDVTGDAGKIGKQVGTDLRDGNPSLPIVWGLELEAVAHAFGTEDCTDADVDRALAALVDSGVPERVRELAVEHAKRAADTVQALPDTRYRPAMLGLVEDLVDRKL